MRMLVFLFVGLGATLAADLPASLELPLENGALIWRERSGWSLRWGDRLVLAADPSPLVLHDPGWTTQYANSSTRPHSGRVETAGGVTTVTIVYPGDDFEATQQVTAGPGDRFAIHWTIRQSNWPDAQLQLGLPKPTKGFFAGAQFTAVGPAGTISEGVIPPTYVDRHPFATASEVTVRSLYGTLQLRSDQPLTLFDYQDGRGTYWLGRDDPLPVGATQTLTVTGELSAPRFAGDGLVVHGLSLEDTVADGLLEAAITAVGAGGPGTANFRITAVRGDDEPLVATAPLTLGAEPATVAAALPVVEPGRYTVRLSVVDGDRTLLEAPEATVTVLPAVTVTPGRSFYTTEPAAELLVTVRPEVAADGILFTAGSGERRLQAVPVPGQRERLRITLADLPDGRSDWAYELRVGDRLVGRGTVALRKLPPKSNEVKIDYATRGLIVDGLATFPFGYYTRWPGDAIAAAVAPFGTTHLAPYRGSGSLMTDDEKQAEVLAVLDRFAAVGVRIHYDLRPIATREDSPEKWALLRREVEAVRDHPALLCWYLADEPELQSIPPERMEQAYRFVQELDPYHPCTQVFADRSKAPAYLGSMDIIMTDPYPIPRSSVLNVAEATATLDAATGQSLPLWIVPQLFGGGEWWQREPSPAEERVMTYLALIHGATGIQYFVRDPGHKRPMPRLLSEARTLTAEAAQLTPALLSELPRPTVVAEPAEVHAAAWRTPDAIWVAAANTVNRPLPFELRLDDGGGEAELPFENRTLVVEQGVIADFIDGFGTRVYRLPLTAEGATAGIEPGNLTINPSFEEQHTVGAPDGYYLWGDPAEGAHIFVDPRTAYHGRHSLRIVVPADGGGHTLQPFPIPVTAGRTYRVSLRARALRPGVKLNLGMSRIGRRSETFTLTDQWQEYSLEGTAPEDHRRGQISYRLETAGTAWVDLVQCVPVEK